MKPQVRHTLLRQSLIALAILAAFGAARADEEPADSPLRASVTVGAAGVTGEPRDRALFGQYNGLRDEDYYGLLGFSYSRRNAETGSWVEATGSNLGLDTREVGLLWKRQGNWRLSAGYGELVRREPYGVNTGIAGAGGTLPQVVYLTGGPGSGYQLDLQTKRTGLTGGVAWNFGPAVTLEADLRSEKKEGARLFGVGMSCPSTVALTCGPTTATATGSVPEPIESRHSQAEARLTFGGDRVRLSAGYYGSFYRNTHETLVAGIPGTLNNPVGSPLPPSAGLQSILGNAVALAPDNDAHQLDVTGNLVITPTTRATFKLAYGTARQDQNFNPAFGAPPAGAANLNGRVDTLMGQFGISARPLPKLSLLADWKSEDRDDKTPVLPYTVEGNATPTTNRVYSSTRIRSKAQATYQLPYRLAATAGVDYEFIDRGAYTSSAAYRGLSALRSETEETGWRLELRRQMTEAVSGAIAWISSERDGSNWLRPNSGSGVTEVTDPATFSANAIFSPTLADRKRDKLRLFGGWQATDALSLQLAAESGKDEYTAPSRFALRDTKMELVSLDVSYLITETWSLNGYLSQGRQKLNQARPEGYILAFDNKTTTAGIGVNGKLGDKVDLGGAVAYINDDNRYAQTLDATAQPATAALLASAGGLPDVQFRRAEFKLFGRYAMSARSALRLDAIHYKARYNDWGYGLAGAPFLFGDNTTVTQLDQQDVTFVGISYTYSWR